ncbi:uncharacterized protein RSE6_11606 [Rhynchosporium secalis]|uniref:Uncharacterized protein n=1 Tax=Rhynchosporium secalis TaxID=38038 RepID=A0A1E1MNE0_RHYSE|nr:uncharacterized protein RSE6_11606 [Rhynchosporium secalis]
MAEQSHITQGKISQKKFQGLENELKEAKRSTKDAKDDLEAAEVDAKKARLELAGTERCTEPEASKLRIDVLNNDNLFCQIASESGEYASADWALGEADPHIKVAGEKGLRSSPKLNLQQ